MESKLVEIRDRATLIVALAVKPGISPFAHIRECPIETCSICLAAEAEAKSEEALWRYAGYGTDFKAQSAYVLLYPAGERLGQTHWDGNPYNWNHYDRTLTTAHKWLTEHFDEIPNGAVVDVEFILGETAVPKVSDGWRP